MKSEVAEIVGRLEQLERSLQAFDQTGQSVRDADLDAYERSWIGAARTRLQRELYAVRSAVEQGIALPELKGQRLDRRLGLERAWLTAARELFDALGTQARPPVFVQSRKIGAGQRHPTRGGRIEAGQQRQQRGFARAGCADNGN